MTTAFTVDFRRHPILLGGLGGIILAVLIAICCPATDMKPGDSKVLMAIVGMIFLVPGCIGTVYATRSATRSIRQMPKLRIFWLAGVSFFTVAVVINARIEWMASRRFIQEGRSVMGNVIEKHPEDHDTLIVGYSISGVDFRTRSEGPRVARSYRPGEPIQIYYYASAPAHGFCIKPRWRPDLILMSWVLAAGILPVWMIGLCGAVALRGRQKPSDTSLDQIAP